jgi:hypothetical protein
MRNELLYTPHLLLQRLAEEATKRAHLRRLRGTCAAWLTHDHLDSLEQIDLAAAAGARDHDDRGGTALWKRFDRKEARP